MNEMKKKMNTGASVVIVALMLTMLFIPLISTAAPIQPFERSGTTTANATVTAWIDGVQYGSNTSDASGNFVIDVNGDDVDTSDVKEGGVNDDIVIYMIDGQFANETDVYVSGGVVTGNLTDATTQPAMLKISKIITQPNDGNNNQYLYIYNPTGSSVDLSDYQLEKDDGQYVSSVHTLSGTVDAGAFAYVELTSDYFDTAGDEVKLNFTTTGVIVDRVEFGSQSAVPDNTVMNDAPAPGLGEEIYRTPNADTDTDDCHADFTTGTATDRIAPTSSADALPTYETTTTFAVTATASDDNTSGNATGVASVMLYWDTTDSIPYGNSAAMTYVSGDNVTGSSWTYDFTGTDGTTYYFYTVATDGAGNVEANPATHDATTTIDATAPSVSITDPADSAVLNTADVTVQWTGSDATSGIDHYNYRIDGGSWSADTTATSNTFSSLSDGSHTVDVQATDGAGNTNTATVSFTVDTTAPSVSITDPADGALLNTTDVTVQWTGSDATSGIDHYNYRIDGGSWSANTTATSNTFSGLSDDSHTVDVQATDGAGNTNTDTVTFTVDTTAPTVASTTPADSATGVAVNTDVVVVFSESMNTSVTPTLSQTSGTSVTYTFAGWSKTNVANDTATWTHDDWNNSETIDLTVDGAEDPAGNAQVSYSWNFTTTSGAGTAAVATGLWVEKNASANNITLHWTDTGSTDWHIYGSQNKSNVTDSANLLATVSGPASSWTHAGAYGDGLNWFYVVRGYDGVSVESTNSTMGYKIIKTLGYNDPAKATNGYWVSIPYNTTYYKDLESIIIDIEGGLTKNDDTYISSIYAWDGANQKRVGMTVGGFGWSGTNVALNPGDAVYIFRSDNTPSPYDWIVNGTDANSTVTLGYNDPAKATNGYWVSVPPSGVYSDLESIIIDIEGGLTKNDDTYISSIYAWDGANQKRVGMTVGGFGWSGTNVALNPGDAVYIFRSDNTPSPYNWTVEVVTPAAP